MRREKKPTAYHFFMGWIQILLGAFLMGYVGLWLLGRIAWSQDITFALMGGLGVVMFVCGVARLVRGRPLFSFRFFLFDWVAKVLFLCIAVALVGSQVMILSAMQETALPDTDYAVVFGARIIGRSPSAMLQKRIEAAVQFAKDHPQTTLIACGGFPEGNEYSEAQVIYDYLVYYGVEPGRILLDEASYDTSQSAQNVDAIIRQRGGAKSVTVISSDYHIFRCKRLFENMGYEAYGVGSQVLGTLRPVAHFREMLSIGRDFLYEISQKNDWVMEILTKYGIMQ